MHLALRGLLAIFVVGTDGFLVYRTLRTYTFDEIVASVDAIPLDHLLSAAGFAAASYFCLTGFEAIGVRYAGYRLPYPKIALTFFVALSIGHTIGIAALSSGVIRYRFYSRWGVSMAGVIKIIFASALTVTLGLIPLRNPQHQRLMRAEPDALLTFSCLRVLPPSLPASTTRKPMTIKFAITELPEAENPPQCGSRWLPITEAARGVGHRNLGVA